MAIEPRAMTLHELGDVMDGVDALEAALVMHGADGQTYKLRAVQEQIHTIRMRLGELLPGGYLPRWLAGRRYRHLPEPPEQAKRGRVSP